MKGEIPEGASHLDRLNELYVLGTAVVGRAANLGVDNGGAAGVTEQLHQQLMNQIEAYAEAFERWAGMAETTSYVPQGDEIRVLKELVGIHTRVLEVAEKFKVSTAQSIGTLKKRGQGIMAYADQGPKKLSVRRPRRG